MILQSITKWNPLKHLALTILLVGALGGGGQLGASANPTEQPNSEVKTETISYYMPLYPLTYRNVGVTSAFYSYTTANQSNMKRSAPNQSNMKQSTPNQSNMKATSDAKLYTGKLDQVKYVCVQPMDDQLKSARGRRSFWEPEHWFRIKTFTIAGQTFAKFTPGENTVRSTDGDKPVMQYEIKIVNNAFDILCVPTDSDIRLSVDRPDSDEVIDNVYKQYLKARAQQRTNETILESIGKGLKSRSKYEIGCANAVNEQKKMQGALTNFKRPPYLYLKKPGST